MDLELIAGVGAGIFAVIALVRRLLPDTLPSWTWVGLGIAIAAYLVFAEGIQGLVTVDEGEVTSIVQDILNIAGLVGGSTIWHVFTKRARNGVALGVTGS